MPVYGTSINVCCIRDEYNIPKQNFVETPKNKLTNVTNILLITNTLAANAMKQKAIKLGYRAKVLRTNLTGEAKTIGKMLSKKAKKGIEIKAMATMYPPRAYHPNSSAFPPVLNIVPANSPKAFDAKMILNNGLQI